MKKNHRNSAILLALSVAVAALAIPNSVHASIQDPWPSATLDANSTNVFDSTASVTNSNPILITVDNTGGTAVRGIGISAGSGLLFGLVQPPGGSNPVFSVSQSPTAGSPYVFSYSGELEAEVWFGAGGGTIVDFRINSTDQVYFNFGSGWIGEFNFRIKANQVTSVAGSDQKKINFSNVEYYTSFQWPASQGGEGNNLNVVPDDTPAPTPAKYSGPEFSGLSGMGIMTGSTGKLEGKRLDQISSIEIGGKAATFTATSATELELSLPAGLAPGLYDLVINSSAGKLTHINAIQVREPKQSFSITTRSTGKISEEQYLEHSLIAAMQAPELNKARCIVNASTQAMAEAMAKRLCAIVKASNPNIETTVVVPRSTVKNDTVFARVIYGWN